MNILLKGKKIHFNKEAFNLQSKLDRSQHYAPTLGLGYNHSIGLDTPDCINRYSLCLRQLIKDCLLREPLARPTSIELVRRTTEGLKTALEAVKNTAPLLPASLRSRNIPFTKITNPEPPTAWTIDTSDFELDMRDRELLTPNAPTATMGSTGLFGSFPRLSVPSLTLSPDLTQGTPGSKTSAAGPKTPSSSPLPRSPLGKLKSQLPGLGNLISSSWRNKTPATTARPTVPADDVFVDLGDRMDVDVDADDDFVQV